MLKICLVVNPIAGMGGRVGLKGTDHVVDEAIHRGAVPASKERAGTALSRLAEAYTRHRSEVPVTWLTATGEMGSDLLMEYGIVHWNVEIVHEPADGTNAEDTRSTVRAARDRGADLIVFCGGDGTARDVFAMAGDTPIFGIPAGVKMHSGVFAMDPTTAGELLEFFIRGEMVVGDGEIMDLDEERYRSGDWNIALYGVARTLHEPSFIQSGKLMIEEESIQDVISELTEDLRERTQTSGGIAILGPGGTLFSIGEGLGIKKTLLGVDIVHSGQLIGSDCTEMEILNILEHYDAGHGRKVPAFIVVSPIGGQGFILGRGNLQISPEVLRRVGLDRIIIVSTPHKLESTRILRVDTGDPELDSLMKKAGAFKVLTGYRTYRLVKVD